MKKLTLSLAALLSAGFAAPATANDLMVAATMQRCTTNEECALVSASCQDNCGFVPVNKENMPTLQGQYQARCGKPVEANPTCNMNPPLSAACINSRCTIDYAYKNNASAGDYQSGAYAVPEAPVPSQVKGDYSKVNDRGGFTAYDLPQNEVKSNTVGTIHTKVYVPPSAPVSGGNYVPVNGAVSGDYVVPVSGSATPSAAPAAPTGVPPQAVPSTPVVEAPAYQVVTPPVAAPAVPATPQLIPPAAPSNIPAMTPSVPNLPPPQAAAPVTAPTQPYQYVAPETIVTAPQPPPPPAVPVAPPGSKPIPPSDLKPVESSVPPPGGTIPVNPEDPGAPPPAGSSVMLKDGNLGMTGTAAAKDFSVQKTPSAVKAKKLGSYN